MHVGNYRWAATHVRLFRRERQQGDFPGSLNSVGQGPLM